MTKMTFYRNKEGQILGFEIEGHTDFALSGSDPLCAAVSTLVSHTIGSVQEFSQDPCENIVEPSIPKVSFFLTGEEFSRESSLFLEAFASSCDDLAVARPENISVEYKEK